MDKVPWQEWEQELLQYEANYLNSLNQNNSSSVNAPFDGTASKVTGSSTTVPTSSGAFATNTLQQIEAIRKKHYNLALEHIAIEEALKPEILLQKENISGSFRNDEAAENSSKIQEAMKKKEADMNALSQKLEEFTKTISAFHSQMMSIIPEVQAAPATLNTNSSQTFFDDSQVPSMFSSEFGSSSVPQPQPQQQPSPPKSQGLLPTQNTRRFQNQDPKLSLVSSLGTTPVQQSDGLDRGMSLPTDGNLMNIGTFNMPLGSSFNPEVPRPLNTFGVQLQQSAMKNMPLSASAVPNSHLNELKKTSQLSFRSPINTVGIVTQTTTNNQGPSSAVSDPTTAAVTPASNFEASFDKIRAHARSKSVSYNDQNPNLLIPQTLLSVSSGSHHSPVGSASHSPTARRLSNASALRAPLDQISEK